MAILNFVNNYASIFSLSILGIWIIMSGFVKLNFNEKVKEIIKEELKEFKRNELNHTKEIIDLQINQLSQKFDSLERAITGLTKKFDEFILSK